MGLNLVNMEVDMLLRTEEVNQFLKMIGSDKSVLGMEHGEGLAMLLSELKEYVDREIKKAIEQHENRRHG